MIQECSFNKHEKQDENLINDPNTRKCKNTLIQTLSRIN